MKLGLLITRDRHLEDIVGLTKAAVSKGHSVIIFNMDDGVKLLEEPSFRELCHIKGVTMSFCDYSTKALAVLYVKTGLPQEIISGSQLNNADMFHKAHRVIAL